jgi:periodic tryptophan protein 2
MKFSYKLKRVCGSVYSNGNLCFTPDGQSVVSPVGNRVNIFDLVNQTSDSLPLECRKDIKLLAISHNGRFLIVIDIDGAALFYNFPRRIVMHRINFRQRVQDIKFSPDDHYFAITYGRGCQIWGTPTGLREFCPLTLNRTIIGHYDETSCVDWSPDSRSLILGSRDLTARVYHKALTKFMALSVLSGHRDSIVGAYFGTTGDDAFTVASDCGLFIWQFSQDTAFLPRTEAEKEDKSDEEEAESAEEEEVEEELEESALIGKANVLKVHSKTTARPGTWKLLDRRILRDGQGEVASCAYNRASHILVMAFDKGVFALYEMPDCINIHHISVSNTMLNTVCISPSGEWLGIGASELGQLLVWEWKSESYVLKQQGHLYGLNTLDYSSEGQFIASGGDDGKVKLWNTQSGFCVITFKEHIAPVTGVKFIGQGRGKALVSSSLDGTIRAHDLLRYKNFRTLSTPTPAQFTCLAADPSGEVVCAGSLDPFNIYVWALQTGKLLEILAGHEAPIACLDYSPSTSVLSSGSWDGTCKLWNVFQNQCIETFEHGCDVMAVAFRPDGKELCCATTNGNIYIWDVEEGAQLRVLEGRADLSGGRLTTDARTAKNSSRSKFFTTVAYSADGSCILAGGRGKYVCIYAVESGVLVKKYQMSYNRSLEGVLDQLRSDRIVDGVSLDNLDVPSDHELDEGTAHKKRLKTLPGSSQKSSMVGVSRTTRPELIASAVRFSPTGREWGVASTQGLQIYALDEGLLFSPVELDQAITPQNIYSAIGNDSYALALNMALHLGEQPVLLVAVTAVPQDSIGFVVKSLDLNMLAAMASFLAGQLNSSPDLGYYLEWVVQLLRTHGPYIQSTRANLVVAESLRSLLRACVIHEKELVRITQDNLFAASYLAAQMHEGSDRMQELQAALDQTELGHAELEGEEEESCVLSLQEGQGQGQEGDGDAVPWSIALGEEGRWTSAWQDDDRDVMASSSDHEQEKAAKTGGAKLGVSKIKDKKGEGKQELRLLEAIEIEDSDDDVKEKLRRKQPAGKKRKDNAGKVK